MNVSDKEIGEWQKSMQDAYDNMSEEERMQHEEDMYIGEILEEHPIVMDLVEKLEQENETLRSANEDLLKENHTLKNFKKVDIDHPSNKFF